MTEQPRAVAYDDGLWWPDSPMSGSAQYVSSDKVPPVPVILVPDGRGDYREHAVPMRPKRRLGF